MTGACRARGATAPAIAVLAVAAALGGCGGSGPQAPLPVAKKLDVSTNGISANCGLSYQITAFPGRHAGAIANLESTVAPFIEKLAVVYHRNPAWVYQGATVAQIVAESKSMLSECGLPRAAAALRLATH